MSDLLPSIGAEVDRRARAPGIPGHGLTYARLADRHQRVTERRELVTKGRDARCSTCGVTWPCEVGQALAIIAALLQA